MCPAGASTFFRRLEGLVAKLRKNEFYAAPVKP
jgi:hypothetical protein